MTLTDLNSDPARRGPGRPRKDADAIRPGTRPEDLDRAARRAAEIRASTVSADDGSDRYFIPPEIIPEGWSYEWKTEEVMGQPAHQHQLHVKRRGWEPVPADRHPEIMVRNGGQVLMERPAEITRDAFVNEQVKARAMISAKEAQLSDRVEAAGVDTNDSQARRSTAIRHSYEHHQIPD